MSKSNSFQEAIEELVANEPTYAAEAYHFLKAALEVAQKNRKKQKRGNSPHVSAEELLDAFRNQAVIEFGPMAPTVLEYWGIRSCEDVGRMVFNLVDAGIFAKTEKDTLDAFREAFDFYDAFVFPFLPPSAHSKKS